jgi:hypothetical protein
MYVRLVLRTTRKFQAYSFPFPSKAYLNTTTTRTYLPNVHTNTTQKRKHPQKMSLMFVPHNQSHTQPSPIAYSIQYTHPYPYSHPFSHSSALTPCLRRSKPSPFRLSIACICIPDTNCTTQNEPSNTAPQPLSPLSRSPQRSNTSWASLHVFVHPTQTQQRAEIRLLRRTSEMR